MIHETAIIYPGVEIEDDVYVGAYSIIGSPPEHREYYDGKETKGVVLKRGSRIFEFVTIHGGTKNPTVIGEGSAVFNKTHIGHDCIIGRGATIGGSCSLAGHTQVMDGANVSGKTCTFQRVVIGAYSFIGGMSFVTRDVPPGEKWLGLPARSIGHNEIGLERSGLTYDFCVETYTKEFERLVNDKG